MKRTKNYGQFWKINDTTYTFDEAKEIGDGIVDFYSLLLRLNGEEHDSTQQD